jgi:predicted aldo/keto reductase-like oxidoreductase
MIYRRFGKTGLSMPVVSFGCMQSMHAWQDAPFTDIPGEAQTTLETILKTALSQGINHVETAYGYGTSERQLGRILSKIPRNEFLLQTKVTPSDDPEEFSNKVCQSLERLRVDRLDLLALHGINDYRSLWQSCRKNGCLAAARKLQDKGVVDHIGFSGHAPIDVIRQALAHDEDGGFEFVNIHWYYIFDANREAIEYAAEQDIGVFIISPTNKGGHLHTPPPEIKRLCAPLSPMLFNDLYCLQQPGVCTISVGASAPEHFDEHLLVLPYLQSGDNQTVSDIDSRLRQSMCEKTGHERPDVLWDQLPPWDQAPGNINLRFIIWLYNLCRGWGLREYGQKRYAMLNKGSSWVPGNSASRAHKIDFSSLSAIPDLSADQLRTLLIKAHKMLRTAGDQAPEAE